MTTAQSNYKQPNTSANDPPSSAYAAAQRTQVHRRLQRWLPLDQASEVLKTSQVYIDLAVRLHFTYQWAEVVAQIKAWLLAQPERWLRLLTALRPRQVLRWMSLSQLVALALSTGLTVSSLSQPFLALAQSPQGSEFQVNTYTTGDQSGPRVVLDADGDFVVVWSDGNFFNEGQDGSKSGIYAQRYNASGAPQGSEFRVNTYTIGDQRSPSLGVDADGDFVVVWESYDQDGSGSGVYAQRYNASGTPQGSEFRVNTYTTGSQGGPSVALDADGDFVVAWTSFNQDGSDDGVYAQRYNSSGAPQGSEFRVNTYITGTQRGPSVALDADGDFVVAWTDLSWQDGYAYGVYAQRYNASGAPQGSEFQVNTYTTGTQRGPSVALDADGDFVVAWTSGSYYGGNQDGNYDGVYAQRYNASGTPQGSEFQVNTTTTGSQFGSNVGVDADGDFVVTWSGKGPSDSSGVFAQRYNAKGTALGYEFRINTTTTGSQFGSNVGVDADGDFVVAWHSSGQDGSNYGVYAQRYKQTDAKIYLSLVIKP